MNLLLQRRPSGPTCTLGELYHGDRRLMYFLEDVIRPTGEKVPGQTAIPPGIYEIVMTASPKYLKQYGIQVTTPTLLNVPNFTGVRIHPGTKAEDTEGCPLPGLQVAQDGKSLLGSGLAYGMFCALVGGAIAAGDRVYLEIENP